MKVKNLSFRYHKRAPYFFKELSFNLEEGLIHALHGKNGVGKSVLLHILSKRIEGEAVISGEIVAEKSALMNQQFDQALACQFTFLENMQFGCLGRFPSPFSCLKAPSYVMQDHFLKLLEKFYIDVTIPVCKLSGGQRQILALLMKLQRETKILFLDEPTAALDEQNATMVFEFLKALKGVTILVVCHDQGLICRYTTGRHLRMEMDSEGLRQLK
jgi:ABC-2 type transport system ATP-binding protein